MPHVRFSWIKKNGNLCFQLVIWKLYAFGTPSIWNMIFPCQWGKYYRSHALCPVYIFSSQIAFQCLHVSSKSASMLTTPSEIKQDTKIRIWKFSKNTRPDNTSYFPNLFSLIWEHFLTSLHVLTELNWRDYFSNPKSKIIYIFISSPRIWNFSNLKQKRRFDLGTISNFANLKLLPLKCWDHFFLSLGFITKTILKPI